MSTNEYRQRSTGSIFQEDEIRRAHPNTALPNPIPLETIVSLGYDPIRESPLPVAAFDEKVVRDGYTQELDASGKPTGGWIKKWKLVKLTNDEIESNRIKHITEFEKQCVRKIQNMMDEFAHSKGYGDDYGNGAIASCVTYADSSVHEFGIDGTYCKHMRDLIWKSLYEFQDQVKRGVRPMPSTVSEVVSAMPQLTWPSLNSSRQEVIAAINALYDSLNIPRSGD